MALEKSTLYKLPTEIRLIIFEYALEEFKSTEERRPPTYKELVDCPQQFTFRLQRVGLLAGLACNRVLYDEALCVYYEKNIFKLTLRNWNLISPPGDFKKFKAIQSIRHLQIQLFDGNISPTDAPKCLQFPWKNLSRNMNCGLLELLTHRRSILSNALGLETLEIFAAGVEEASQIIGDTINLLYQAAPKLRKVVVKFPLHEKSRQQTSTMMETIKYMCDQPYDIAIPRRRTLTLLNRKLGKASCVRWEGHLANLIGTATWQARKGRVLTSSKNLEDLNGEPQKFEDVLVESLSGIRRGDFEERRDTCLELIDRMYAMLAVPQGKWSFLTQEERDHFDATGLFLNGTPVFFGERRFR